jgi:hypothetical protein
VAWALAWRELSHSSDDGWRAAAKGEGGNGEKTSASARACGKDMAGVTLAACCRSRRCAAGIETPCARGAASSARTHARLSRALANGAARGIAAARSRRSAAARCLPSCPHLLSHALYPTTTLLYLCLLRLSERGEKWKRGKCCICSHRKCRNINENENEEYGRSVTTRCFKNGHGVDAGALSENIFWLYLSALRANSPGYIAHRHSIAVYRVACCTSPGDSEEMKKEEGREEEEKW